MALNIALPRAITHSARCSVCAHRASSIVTTKQLQLLWRSGDAFCATSVHKTAAESDSGTQECSSKHLDLHRSSFIEGTGEEGLLCEVKLQCKCDGVQLQVLADFGAVQVLKVEEHVTSNNEHSVHEPGLHV